MEKELNDLHNENISFFSLSAVLAKQKELLRVKGNLFLDISNFNVIWCGKEEKIRGSRRKSMQAKNIYLYSKEVKIDIEITSL